MADKIKNLISDISNQTFNKMGVSATSSTFDLARSFTQALTTSVKVGLDEQIALITVLDHMSILPDKFSFIDKGTLEFGVGEAFYTYGFKNSKTLDTTTNDKWVPEGTVKSLEKYQSQSSGFITRIAENQYSVIDFKKYFRDAQTFNQLLSAELKANSFTNSMETREAKRYIFGVNVDNKYLPQDYKTSLDPVKNLIGQNKTDVEVNSAKEAINKLREFAQTMYIEISDKYNLASKDQTGGNLFINNVDTKVKPLSNTWNKDDTVIIMSIKMYNKLIQELGDTYNPRYWQEFSELFGTIILENLKDPWKVTIIDNNAVRRKLMYEEYSATYYPRAQAVDCVGVYRETYAVVPWLNCIAFNFTGIK